ncbi:cell wall-binding repeat-containing protein, partial [Clostridium tetanomorphum]
MESKKLKIKKALSLGIVTSIILITRSGSVQAFDKDHIKRIWGQDRYETSIKISQKGWEQGSEYVIIASGEGYADALSAAPLAKIKNASIILTKKNNLDDKVLEELKRLKVKHVLIIGGEGSVSKNVEDMIKKNVTSDVNRIGGENRYETSVKVAEQLGEVKNVFIVSGENYADALSVGSIAGIKGMPIILTERDNLSKEVSNYINDNNIAKAYIIGGTASIGEEVKKALPMSERINGLDRYETNKNVVERFISSFDLKNVYIALGDGQTGNEFADALSGSSLAAQKLAPIILADKSLQNSTQKLIEENILPTSSVNVLGGNFNIPDDIMKDINISAKFLDKAGEVYSNAIYGNAYISQDNITLKGDVKGNLYIEGNNVLVSNITVGGIVYINPSKDGKITLDSVKSDKIVVLSGSKNGIDLKNVKSKYLNLRSRNMASVNINDSTLIENTKISSPSTLEVNSGSFGNIEINDTFDSDKVEFKGVFDKPVTIKSEANLNMISGTTIYNVILDSHAIAKKIKFNGTGSFGNVYNKNNTVSLELGAKVSVCGVIEGLLKNSIISDNINNKMQQKNTNEFSSLYIPEKVRDGGSSGGSSSSSYLTVSSAIVSDINVANGTILNDIGLPSTVSINLSNNTKTTAAVTWDGGTPAYDGTKAGGYTFTGTIKVPEGVKNTNNVKAIMKVIVGAPVLSNEKSIISTNIGKLSKENITEVPAGTKVSALKAGLKVSDKASVEILTSAGSTVVEDQENVDVASEMVIKVTAEDGSSQDYSIIITPIMPEVPSTFTVNAPTSKDNKVNDDGKSRVLITWTDSTTITVDHYEIVAKVGSVPTVTDTVSGQTAIAKGTGAASFDWTAGENLHVAVVAVDANGLKTLCKGAISNVIVAPDTQTPIATTKNITSVGKLTDIEIENGTPKEALNLPALVPVTLDNGSTINTGVTWDTTSYKGSKAGTYKIEGTLTLPANVTNSKNLKAVQNVIVKAPVVTTKNIIFIQNLIDLTVLNGTTVEALNLPAKWPATLEDGSEIMVGITWYTSSYDGSKAGTYKIEGTLILPENITNSNKFKVVQNITVKAPGIKTRDIIVLPYFGDTTVLNGTAVEALNLPTEDLVSLEDGSDIMVGITWDTTNYDGSKAGTYKIEGTLILPANVTNTKNLKVVKNITVKAPGVKIRDIMVLSGFGDLLVLNGTAVEALNLPAEAPATLEDGSIIIVGITWDTTNYDGSKAGTYRLEGTLILPTNVTNSKNLKAMQNVIVKASGVTTKDIMVLPYFRDVTVLNGTAVKALNLPAEVLVPLEDGSIITIGVTWDTTSYDGSKAGTYRLEGTLTLPANVTNSKNLKAVQNVIVKAPGVTTKDIMFPPGFGDLLVLNGTAVEALNLPAEVLVSLEDGSRIMVGITWDTTSYDGGKAGTYKIEGTLTLPSNVTNSKNFKAVQNVIVKAPGVTT